MRKTIQQDAFTRQVLAGAILNLETPWLGGPVQGQMGAGGLQLSALLGAEVEVSWRVLPIDNASLGTWQATLQEFRADLDGGEDIVSVSYDVSGQFLNGDGEITLQCGPDPLVRYILTLTNRAIVVETVRTVRVQRLITAEFSPHRSPADAQDAQGAGYGGVVAVPAVPVAYPIRDQSPLAGFAGDMVDQPNGDDPMWSGELDDA